MKLCDLKTILRLVGMALLAEGFLMMLCIIPAVHFADGTALPMLLSSLATLLFGLAFSLSFRRHRELQDSRMAYLLVVVLWVAMALFAMLPFLTTGATVNVVQAWFEAMSGVSTTGATIFDEVGSLPSSVLLWRSMSQWFGGFGVVLLVLALSPRLGINKYALYSAEASAADNSGRVNVRTTVTVRRTLSVYLILTLLFIALLRLSGMHLWDAVNLTLTNISSGGFALASDSIASLTHLQQYILALAMFFSGVNFSLLYLLLSFRWRQVGHKFDQFRFYILAIVVGAAFVVVMLHTHDALPWADAFRLGLVQTISAATTTGSVIADTTLWCQPVLFVLLILSICGGMAGSTSGGIKSMRVLILLRNVRSVMLARLHPHLVMPLTLNGRAVSRPLVNNVMVIFLVYVGSFFVGLMLLAVCGVDITQALGAVVGCLTGYGPGLGASGGFGSYSAFPPVALGVCSLLMLMGRLECLTVLLLFLPRFWRRSH